MNDGIWHNNDHFADASKLVCGYSNSPEFPDGSVCRKSRITAEKGLATVKDYLTVQNGNEFRRVVKENLTTDREDMKVLEEMEKALEKRGNKKLEDEK